ncbi:HlyD family type I secretion periplasmic adaptor subunit [Bradyrhizobium sp. JYMT SZCCT0180]|uniref:HlyD family type I secretion periplasmic adaptor subunit n=1 Tax=Bradyrhizobium sp. JYMT SZCCT0180 TaxID=2807666 RepID=UPI001BA4DC96|nr:HlyD family type I secretion periplasmic adaptor subunit [Bradyrhizobium sp. JYMT SZCCT0180]MBR1211572.1 HlyD family type I secretion periplasmic adaptor subunit [Bradyrhizobium sp. JYMT SZCCT0180]
MNALALNASDQLYAAKNLDDHRGYGRLGFAAIALVFGGFGVWAGFAPLDRAAIAQGQVAVESSNKPVQHLEGGIVREILVRDAQQVKEGDVLLRLQPTNAQANLDLLRKQIDANLAQEARLVAEQTRADQIKFPADLLARRKVAETEMAIRDQERQFRERKQSLDGQIGILAAQIEQKQQDITGRTRQRDSLAAQMTSYKTEMTTVFPLVAKGFYARNKYLALERDANRVEGEFGLAESDILRFGKAIEEAKLQIKQARFKFDDEVSTALNDIRAKISDAREKIVMAEDVLTRVDVRAPRSGTVLGLKVHGVGAVVKPGETLAEIVPLGEGLLVTARVQPSDIESVEVGHTAEVRFANFSSRQVSVILGKVVSIAPDATVDQTGNQQQQQPYFAVKIVIDYSAVPENIAKKIQPGMQADILISTGERTALTYFIAPLTSTFAKTFREK